MDTILNEIKKGEELMVYSSKETVTESLKKDIESATAEGNPVTMIISEGDMECRNMFEVEDYELRDNYLYLGSGWFELHIDLEETEIEYDQLQDLYLLKYKDVEISLCIND